MESLEDGNIRYTFVTKGQEERQIKITDLSKYEIAGWSEGILFQHFMTDGKRVVLVQPDELQHYKQLGYTFKSVSNK